MNIIDLHCDTIDLLESEKDGGDLFNNSFSVDIQKLRQGGSLAQFFAMYINKTEHKNVKEKCISLMKRFYFELDKYKDYIALSRNFEEMYKNNEKGKISAFLTIEEGAVLEGNMENLYYFFENGVRLITLTWNHPNEIGFPSSKEEYSDKGLTSFGKDLIGEMNRLGMIVDVSHLSDKGFHDVAEVSTKPFIASHSNAREITPHRRNLSDDMIRVLSEKGGVMGINFYYNFLQPSGDSYSKLSKLGDSHIAKVEDMVRHIKHIRNAGGIDCIALGTDFDGIGTPVEIEDFSQMDKLVFALEKEGFFYSEIEKICYKNAERIMKDVLK